MYTLECWKLENIILQTRLKLLFFLLKENQKLPKFHSSILGRRKKKVNHLSEDLMERRIMFIAFFFFAVSVEGWALHVSYSTAIADITQHKTLKLAFLIHYFPHVTACFTTVPPYFLSNGAKLSKPAIRTVSHFPFISSKNQLLLQLFSLHGHFHA